MEEQSDTPRTDATQYQWTRTLDLSRDLERELATATRERDEARALNAEWGKKAETWMASPEAAQRLQGYRELAQQVATAQNERDEARAEVERLRSALQVAGSKAGSALLCGQSTAENNGLGPMERSFKRRTTSQRTGRAMRLRKGWMRRSTPR